MAKREDKKDKYASFAELARQEKEGEDFSVSVLPGASDFSTVIIAPHGGGIEPGTSEIARAIAGKELRLALFEGRKNGGNCDLHITSANFDEPRCVEIVERSDFVLAIHGEGNEQDAIVYIGGLDRDLGQAIASELKIACFDVQEHPDSDLQGVHPNNICNRGTRGRGVQLEITQALRAQFFKSPEWNRRRNAREDKDKTEKFEQFIAAVRRGLRCGGAL